MGFNELRVQLDCFFEIFEGAVKVFELHVSETFVWVETMILWVKLNSFFVFFDCFLEFVLFEKGITFLFVLKSLGLLLL